MFQVVSRGPFLTTIGFSLNPAHFKQLLQTCIISCQVLWIGIEDINRHRGSINLLPIDIPEKTFEVEDNVQFDPLKLDYDCPEKEKITKAVVKMLKKITEISNSNLVKNAYGLLSKRNVDEEVEWIADNTKRLPEGRLKMSYRFFSC